LNVETTKIHHELLSEVSGENLMQYTTKVAKEVRLSGSDEELRAFHYVRTQLEGFGLKTQLLFQDAYISLPKKAHLKIDGKLVNCITHSMAPSTGSQGITGSFVYMGELSESNLESLEVNGRIVVLDGIALPSSVEKVESLGAIGVIFINGPLTHEMIVSTVWGNPTPESVYPNIPVVSVDEKAGETLKNSHNKACWLMTEVETRWRKIPTLVAELKGVTEPDKFLLFSGHIDSWHYGAMDNASANATMLEVARILSKHQSRLRRSVRFAFWSGHSHGRYAGSAAYCDSHFEDLHENCFLHVYVDSVGGKGANILSESNCMAETKELAARIIESQTGESFIGKRFARAGDQSFWGTGVPSLFMGMSEQPISDDAASQALFKIFGGKKAGGFGWWWHTAEDTVDKIDEANLVRDCKVYTAAIFEACSNKIVPINQREAIHELFEAIERYQSTAGKQLSFETTLNRLETLKEHTEKLYECISSDGLSETEAKRLNHGIIKLSRSLVPLNYVEGDIFDHDLAIYQEPIPLLGKVAELANAEVGSNEFYRLKTLLIRRVNKINHALLNANNLVLYLLESR
jgi:hypothetical protein